MKCNKLTKVQKQVLFYIDAYQGICLHRLTILRNKGRFSTLRAVQALKKYNIIYTAVCLDYDSAVTAKGLYIYAEFWQTKAGKQLLAIWNQEELETEELETGGL